MKMETAAGIRLSSSSPSSLHHVSPGTILRRFRRHADWRGTISLSLSLVLQSSFRFQWDVKDGWKRNCCFFYFGFIFFLKTQQQLQQKATFQPNSSGHQLSGTGGDPFDTPCPLPFFTSDPIRSCTVFISKKICYFRTTEILVSTTVGLKYVNMYLGQFQWPCLVGVFYFCLFPPLHCSNSQDFKFFNATFGRKGREEKTVCKSFQIFQRD